MHGGYAHSITQIQDNLPTYSRHQGVHPKNKRCFQAPFLVLQFVTNRGLVSVPGRTNQYLEEPQ